MGRTESLNGNKWLCEKSCRVLLWHEDRVINDQVTWLQCSSAVSALDRIGWPSKGGITIRLKAKSNLVLMAEFAAKWKITAVLFWSVHERGRTWMAPRNRLRPSLIIQPTHKCAPIGCLHELAICVSFHLKEDSNSNSNTHTHPPTHTHLQNVTREYVLPGKRNKSGRHNDGHLWWLKMWS